MKNPLFFGRLCMCGHHEIDFLFSFFFRKRKREQLDERDPLLCCAVCLYIFLDIFFIFFCSSAWTWTLCVSVIAPTHTHTQSLSSILFFFSSSFFFVFWWQVINHMLICGLYLLSLFFSPPQFPSTISISPSSMERRKKNSFLPSPHKSFYRLESRSRWCTSRCPFFYV